eukprot:3315295-Amphidinium_carterae.1
MARLACLRRLHTGCRLSTSLSPCIEEQASLCEARGLARRGALRAPTFCANEKAVVCTRMARQGKREGGGKKLGCCIDGPKPVPQSQQP